MPERQQKQMLGRERSPESEHGFSGEKMVPEKGIEPVYQPEPDEDGECGLHVAAGEL